jgi:hypothetical protein
LNAGLWFRRGRLLICSPVMRPIGRRQAENPLIPLCSFARPPLNHPSGSQCRSSLATEEDCVQSWGLPL